MFPDLGVPIPLCSRALVETRLRTHVRRLPNVTLLDRTVVRAVYATDGRVRGIEAFRDGGPLTLDAELVVDASGRSARTRSWVRDLGMAPPAISRVDVDITYTAVTLRRHAQNLDGALFAVVQHRRAGAHRRRTAGRA